MAQQLKGIKRLIYKYIRRSFAFRTTDRRRESQQVFEQLLLYDKHTKYRITMLLIKHKNDTVGAFDRDIGVLEQYAAPKQYSNLHSTLDVKIH